MEIKQFNPSSDSSNVFMLIEDKRAIIVDCGIKSKKVFDYLDQNGIKGEFLLLTHGHYDHCFCAAAYAERGMKIYMSSQDLRLIRMGLHIPPDMLSLFKPFGAQLLSDGMTLDFCGTQINAIFTPGHTAGGYCFLCDDYLFSGDTLFYETVGRTDLPTGDRTALKTSIDKLFALDDNVKVLAGHGKPSTIGHEKKYNIIAKNL